MMRKADALKGGMPLYKWVGNQVLTTFQNAMLGSRLSEFHSGYRLYSVEALKQIPFERNSNDFHFDTEIIVQFVLQGLAIVERPIPTFYGDEICHVDGLKYAWDVVKTMLGCKAHGFGLLYDRRFDVTGFQLGRGAAPGPLKLGYPSSHTLVLESARPGKVLVWGTESAALLAPLARRGVCAESAQGETVPPDLSAFPQIFLLDALEHFAEPERFVEALRAAACRTRPEITLTTPNIGFFIPRLMLLLGEFNYSRRGILDRGHRRLFTFRSLRALMRQAGYTILETRGLPAPFPKALGDNFLSRALLRINQGLIGLAPGLFSYEIVLKVQAHPTVHALLDEMKANVTRQVLLESAAEVQKAAASVARARAAWPEVARAIKTRQLAQELLLLKEQRVEAVAKTGLIADAEVQALQGLVERKLKSLHFRPPRFGGGRPLDSLRRHPLLAPLSAAAFEAE